MGTIATFVGGPLDGQTTDKGKGPWATFRNDQGIRIRPRTGDREWSRPKQGKGEPRCHYICHSWSAVETVNGERAIVRHAEYIHATVWDAYRARRGL